jgi:signal transduction histidine kinase
VVDPLAGPKPKTSGSVSTQEQLLQHPAGFLGRVSMNGETPTLFVSQQSDGLGPMLYLVFFSEDVSQLAFYFGILPLSLALLLVYGFSLLTYRLSHRAISPIVKLADYLEEFRFGGYNQPAVDLGDLRVLANLEVDVMIDAIDSFAERLDTFIERERIFTRDASHELRTPIAVFKGSLDLLQRKSDRSEDDEKAFARMRRTVEDMEGLIETLLLLARGEEVERIHEIRCLNDLVPGFVEQLVPMAADRGLDLSIDEQAQLGESAIPRHPDHPDEPAAQRHQLYAARLGRGAHSREHHQCDRYGHRYEPRRTAARVRAFLSWRAQPRQQHGTRSGSFHRAAPRASIRLAHSCSK